MKFICPLVTVSDMERSRQFYESLLGQEVKFDFGENITFHGDFAIHLRSHFKKLVNNKKIRQGGNNFELYFEYDNVEELVIRLKENKVVFVHDLMEQPWRQKVVRFYDPDENMIEVGETLDHLSYRLAKEGLLIEQIAEITNMPMEFVKNAIKLFSNK